MAGLDPAMTGGAIRGRASGVLLPGMKRGRIAGVLNASIALLPNLQGHRNMSY
jgi:hypothetical protein